MSQQHYLKSWSSYKTEKILKLQAENAQLRSDSESLRQIENKLENHYGHPVSVGKVLEDLEDMRSLVRRLADALADLGGCECVPNRVALIAEAGAATEGK